MTTKEQHREYQRRYKNKPGIKEKYAKLNKNWIAKNRQQYNRAKSEYRFRVKIEVLSLYSNGPPRCSLCGFNADVDALCLDHINNDGKKHRKELGVSSRGNNGGTTIYERIRALGKFPNLQVLCCNCNTIKELRRKRGNIPSAEFLMRRSKPIAWK